MYTFICINVYMLIGEHMSLSRIFVLRINKSCCNLRDKNRKFEKQTNRQTNIFSQHIISIAPLTQHKYNNILIRYR